MLTLIRTLAFLTVFTLATSASAQTALPLIQQSNVKYLGSFELPNAGPDPNYRTIYGGHALGIGPNNTLYFGGHSDHQRLCQATIPAIGGEGSFVGTCVKPPDELGSPGETSILGGTLLWNNRLILSQHVYYDGNASARYSHSTATPQRTNFTNPVKVGDLNPGFYGGYMAVIPQEWRTLLGGPALTGQALLSIVSRTSYGPAAFVFDPDNVGRVSPVPAAPLVYYPQANPLASGTDASPYMTFADTVGGIAFPAGTRSVLFIGRHGSGPVCYKNEGPVGCRGTGGYNSPPYVSQVWAYDANDLLKVKNGQMQAWAVRPYAMFPLPGNVADATTTRKGGVVFDPTTRRLYLTGDYGGSPRVHVYEIVMNTPPPPVHCEVSVWSAWLPTSDWSVCTNNSQFQSEQRTRSIVTPPSNGGNACPALVETRTVTRACTVTAPGLTALGRIIQVYVLGGCTTIIAGLEATPTMPSYTLNFCGFPRVFNPGDPIDLSHNTRPR